MKTYGITLGEYNRILIAQGNVCAICKSSYNGKKKFFVDHNHVTGKVRGLLCHKCNILLGGANDSIETLKTAIQYLADAESANDSFIL